jgi:hypothetical protein
VERCYLYKGVVVSSDPQGHGASTKSLTTSVAEAAGKESHGIITTPFGSAAGASQGLPKSQILGREIRQAALHQVDGAITAHQFAHRAGDAVSGRRNREALLNDDAVERLLTALIAPLEWADLSDAVGLVLEIRTADGYVQILGPYPLDTVEVVQAVQILKSEERSDEEPNRYTVRPLFPPAYAVRP